jgi:signal transduction histidine kinase
LRFQINASDEEGLTLTIEDDGHNFDPRDKKMKQGRGLANIRARASLIDADVTWRKRPGGGTIFTLHKSGISVRKES